MLKTPQSHTKTKQSSAIYTTTKVSSARNLLPRKACYPTTSICSSLPSSSLIEPPPSLSSAVTVPLVRWIFKCRLRLDWTENPLWQCGHANGFSPVWLEIGR